MENKEEKKFQELEQKLSKLPIIDLFVSLQGEGMRTGFPSLFIRVSGCNLRCCFKDTICDTAYSSFTPEKGHFTLSDITEILRANVGVQDIVITGGEPMLYQAQIKDLIKGIRDEFPLHDFIFTMETNGTIEPTDNLGVDLYSMSPKLSTSIPSPNKVYKDPTGKTYQFTEERCVELDKIRRNTQAILKMIDSADYQLKFVYSGPESIVSIDELLNDIWYNYGCHVDKERIMLMPEGINQEQINKNGREAAQVCIEKGWRLSDRLHIRLWGDQRGY